MAAASSTVATSTLLTSGMRGADMATLASRSRSRSAAGFMNVDVATVDDAAAIRDALYRQAFSPVRWVEVVQALRARGLSHLIECGPGKALSGMVRRIDVEAATMTLFDPQTLAEAKKMLA